MRVGSLFTGGGGLDMAVKALFPDARIAWTSEVDKAASKLIAARYLMSPNHGDITAIDWHDVEPVDVLVGGFPCQDISHAGKRAGITEETRSGLWFHFRDAIRVLRPRLVLVENVAAITAAGGGLDVVLGSLAEIGFDAEWGLLRASDVGAPHRRDRWFAVAWPADDPDGAGRREALEHHGREAAAVDGSGVPDEPDRVAAGAGPDRSLNLLPTPAAQEPGGTVEQYHDRLRAHDGRAPTFTPLGMLVRTLPTPRSNADRTSRGALTRDGHWSAPALAQAVELASGILPREYESWDEVQGWHGKRLPTPMAGDAKGARNSTATRHKLPPTGIHAGDTLSDIAHADRWGEYGPAVARWETILGRCAPDPTDDKGRLSPAFVEWMMGWPEGWIDLDGLSRANRLKILGNGVVPQQAAAAYGALLDRARSDLSAVA